MRTRFTQTENGYRWTFGKHGNHFVAYPQQRCTTDTGKVYFRYCRVPVAFFESAEERENFVVNTSAKFWVEGTN